MCLLASFYLPLLEGSRQILTAPILLRIVLHRAAVGLHLLIKAAAVYQNRLAGLGVPAALAEHFLQLLYRVAALPFPDSVLLHSTVAPPQGLWETRTTLVKIHQQPGVILVRVTAGPTLGTRQLNGATINSICQVR